MVRALFFPGSRMTVNDKLISFSQVRRFCLKQLPSSRSLCPSMALEKLEDGGQLMFA